MQEVLGKAGQYKDAVKLVWEWVANLEGTGVELSFMGHSLGGSLATAAALATGKEAIVFEAASVSSKSMQNPKLSLDINNASRITNFNVRKCYYLSDWNHQMDETTLAGHGQTGCDREAVWRNILVGESQRPG